MLHGKPLEYLPGVHALPGRNSVSETVHLNLLCLIRARANKEPFPEKEGKAPRVRHSAIISNVTSVSPVVPKNSTPESTVPIRCSPSMDSPLSA